MDARALLQTLRESVRSSIGDEKRVAVAYSGGLDSSVIAALARERAEVRAYTCSTEGSFDKLNAAARAEGEGLRHIMIELSPRDVVDCVLLASRALGSVDPVQIAYTIPLATVVCRAEERRVLAGNGADELFGGYAKYANAGDPAGLMEEDLARASREAERMTMWAASAGKILAFPFLGDGVKGFSCLLKREQKISATTRKVILREVATLLNLSSSSLPKKAAQYSSGILKEMRRAAKADGVSLAEWTERIASAHGRSA